MNLLQLVLTVAFVLSGAAGLIYESIWSRYLGLFVGHSAYAQTIVLVIFLGGMSAGAAWTARHSDTHEAAADLVCARRGRRGIIGFAFHGVFGVVTAFCYDTLFPALPGGATLTVAKWGIAALLILPQSVLLGTTFPLMSAGYLRAASPDGRTGSGRVLANLYFANSLGAAVGVLVAGLRAHSRVRAAGHAAGRGHPECRGRRDGRGRRAVRARGRRPWTRHRRHRPRPRMSPMRVPAPVRWNACCWPSRSAPRCRRSSTRSPGCACCRWCWAAPRTRSN